MMIKPINKSEIVGWKWKKASGENVSWEVIDGGKKSWNMYILGRREIIHRTVMNQIDQHEVLKNPHENIVPISLIALSIPIYLYP